MLENFKTYLIKKGYSEFTPSGNPSTVYDYMKRVEKIRSRENISINELSENISYYVEKYDYA
jgi:ribosome-binding protein aMBF1 (putative translation factor)